MPDNFKDNFSAQSKKYSFSRPTYPDELFRFLADLTANHDLAWDCATGNGQAAIELCKYFDKVIASDASEKQIQNRFERKNILYRVFPAEKADIPNNSVDLITIAQGLHWFDLEQFYSEAKRVAKKDAIIAAWSYTMHKITPEIDRISDRLNFGGDILGNYWAQEIRYVKDDYKTIPFPFEEIPTPKFSITTQWNLIQLLNYLDTWSAVQKYRLEENTDPLILIKNEIQPYWKNDLEVKPVTWEINLKIGKIM
jgi:hypothetical protein